MIDADGHHTDTYMDLLGRTTRTVFDDGSFTETLYGVSGDLMPGYEVPIPLGGSEKVEIAQRKADDPIVATYYLSDASGNLTDVWQPAVPDPNSSDGATIRPHTHYGYDQEGDETSQTDANNETTTFTFDQSGDQLTRTLPPAAAGDAPNTESFTYDVYNQVATHVDFDGNTATYTYLSGSDPNAGSLYRVVYGGAPNSGKATQTVTYVLDDMGRQHEIADASGTTTDSYDPEGDLIEQDTPQGIIHHAFDPATGQLIETWTNFTDIAYGYNPLGELQTTTVNRLNGQTLSAPLVTADYYDPAGNKKTETLPDGEQTTWNYDDLDRLLGVSEVQDGAVVKASLHVIDDLELRASETQPSVNGEDLPANPASPNRRRRRTRRLRAGAKKCKPSPATGMACWSTEIAAAARPSRRATPEAYAGRGNRSLSKAGHLMPADDGQRRHRAAECRGGKPRLYDACSGTPVPGS